MGILTDQDLNWLCKKVHESWMQRRLDEGWSFGQFRDDEKKEHPSIVPYEALSLSEKNYDRTTIEETIKGLLELGYKIEKNKESKA